MTSKYSDVGDGDDEHTKELGMEGKRQENEDHEEDGIKEDELESEPFKKVTVSLHNSLAFHLEETYVCLLLEIFAQQ